MNLYTHIYGIYVSACSCELMHVEVRGQSGCSRRSFSTLFVCRGMCVTQSMSGGHRMTFGSWLLPSTLFETGSFLFLMLHCLLQGFSHLFLPTHWGVPGFRSTTKSIFFPSVSFRNPNLEGQACGKCFYPESSPWPHPVFEGVSLSPDTLIQLDWLASGTQGSFHLSLSVTGATSGLACPGPCWVHTQVLMLA